MDRRSGIIEGHFSGLHFLFFFDYAQANTPVQLLLMGWRDNLAMERKGYVFLHLGDGVEDSHAITGETGQRLLPIVGSKG
jgi:hypothetical protein